MLETEGFREVHDSVVKRFVDVIILGELRKNGPLSGYDIVSLIHQKFHVAVSPGKLYSVLYALERNSLVKGKPNVRKRIYTLTNKGEKTLMQIVEGSKGFLPYLSSLFEIDLKSPPMPGN